MRFLAAGFHTGRRCGWVSSKPATPFLPGSTASRRVVTRMRLSHPVWLLP